MNFKIIALVAAGLSAAALPTAAEARCNGCAVGAGIELVSKNQAATKACAHINASQIRKSTPASVSMFSEGDQVDIVFNKNRKPHLG